ncbi:hypothetical protein PVAND_017099 [Polypedilum vanderplanki]|uniref:Ig-like domain-containing protein n=1 Tax=Polypedilum vanderplanki TaxID=319348 RepID=A0A9J6BIF2_POLVA|nr:hypothetical protein PVAND_017099 [Polypedilum vanderplanki]
MRNYLILLFLSAFLIVVKGEENEPEFLQPFLKFIVPVGHNVTFRCEFKNLGNFKIGWIKENDNKLVLALGSRMITQDLRISANLNENFYELYITKVDLNDSGIYACRVNTDPPKQQIGILEVIETI